MVKMREQAQAQIDGYSKGLKKDGAI
jgi:hypothetical protein